MIKKRYIFLGVFVILLIGSLIYFNYGEESLIESVRVISLEPENLNPFKLFAKAPEDISEYVTYHEDSSTYEVVTKLGNPVANATLNTPKIYKLDKEGYQMIGSFTITPAKNFKFDINKISSYDIWDFNTDTERVIDYKIYNGTVNVSNPWGGVRTIDTYEDFTDNNFIEGQDVTLYLFSNVSKGDYFDWVPQFLIDDSAIMNAYEWAIVIVVEQATHLNSTRGVIGDVYDEVRDLDSVYTDYIPENDFVRVTFERNLTYENDITLYALGNGSVEVYEKDSDFLLMTFDNEGGNIAERKLLTNFNGSSDTFDLKVVNGSLAFDWVVDPVGCDGSTTATDSACKPLFNIDYQSNGWELGAMDKYGSCNLFCTECAGQYNLVGSINFYTATMVLNDSQCDIAIGAGTGDCALVEVGDGDDYFCPSYDRNGGTVTSTDCTCVGCDFGVDLCDQTITDLFNLSNEFFTTSSGGGGDSCTYGGSGIWLIDCSDNCAITSNANLPSNDIFMQGTGEITLLANVTADRLVKENTCTFVNPINDGNKLAIII